MEKSWYLRIFRKLERHNSQLGFTYIELSVVMGIIAVLFGLVTINLSKAQRSTSLNSAVESLTADIKSQQLKAMGGATEGRATSDTYGIYFQSGSYTLFHGTTYYPGDTTNFVVNADSGISYSTTVPNNLLIFSKVSGEMMGWSNIQDTITVIDTVTNTSKKITINQLGVITSVQ